MMNQPLVDTLRERSHVREIDRVRLKGLAEPTTLFSYDERSRLREAAHTLVTKREAAERPLEYLRLYQEGLARYRAGEFAKAFELFDKTFTDYRDPPSRCMRERVVKIMDSANAGLLEKWDGVWSMETK